ncbi:PLP-dependent aminotransferase family protein [Pendulispora albinea]|uniref:PLP-dependent aminotransferase family protein n=1 Tax=Pendulispora albinea TaxID=2741071 RepID=A0ABZ2M2G2_9BACT
MALLKIADLHASLSDPLLERMNFLNEITLRYPNAISFGPGRPYEGFFEVSRLREYLDAYVAYLEKDLRQSPDEVTTSLFQYGRTNGQIHELVAKTLANDEGIHVAKDSVVVTVGCQEAMFIVLRALFAAPEDVLLVSSPCYVGITGAARLLDIDMAAVPERDGQLDVAVLRQTIHDLRARGKRPRALYVIPDFSNPSGSSMSLENRRQLLALAGDEAIVILEDNPYGFFVGSGDPKPTLKSLDTAQNVLYFGSFAKTCFPSARVGYVVADAVVEKANGERAPLADELSKIKSMITVNTPAIAQALIGGMLVANGCRLRDTNQEKIAFYRNNISTLVRALEQHFPAGLHGATEVRWNIPEGGFFLVVTLPFDADDALLETSARDHGVIWTPMRYFCLDGAGDKQLRLSCSYLTPERIEEGVSRLASVVRQKLGR